MSLSKVTGIVLLTSVFWWAAYFIYTESAKNFKVNANKEPHSWVTGYDKKSNSDDNVESKNSEDKIEFARQLKKSFHD